MVTRTVVRYLLLALLLATAVHVVAIDEADEAVEPEKAAEGEVAAAAEPEPEVVLNCKTDELLDKIENWSVHCVAMWLENLGFGELKAAFMGNQVDGNGLKTLTMAKLEEDYGVSDEEQRKKIYYNLKDVLKKDDYSGNTNHNSQMLMWVLPFAAIYLWVSLKYEKEIARYRKKYRKWQEARNPPKPVTEADRGSFIDGLNKDLDGGEKKKKEKKSPKEAKAKKTPKAD